MSRLLLFLGFCSLASIATAVENWTTAKTTLPEQVTIEVLAAEMVRVNEPLVLRLRITNPTEERYQLTKISVKLFDWVDFHQPEGLPLTLEAHHHGEGNFILEHGEKVNAGSKLIYNYGLHDGKVAVHYIAIKGSDPMEVLEPDPQEFQSDDAVFVVSPIGAWWVIGLGALAGVLLVVVLIAVHDRRVAGKTEASVVRRSLPYLITGVVVVVVVMLFSGSEALSEFFGLSFEAKDFRGGLVIGVSFPAVARALIGVGAGQA